MSKDWRDQDEKIGEAIENIKKKYCPELLEDEDGECDEDIIDQVIREHEETKNSAV